jgi:Predicted membrane protein
MVNPMVDPPQNSSVQNPERTARERTSPIIERNVRALVELAAEQERANSTADRIAMAISRFAGSMKFVYFHAVVFGLWAAADKGWLPGIHNFDPTFIGLNTTATVEAIFLATFVLIAQNRLVAHGEIRNHLDVQVGLLTEHETTHILRLVVAMSHKMEIEQAHDPEIAQLVRNVEPQEMIDQIEVHTDAVEEQIKEDIAEKKRRDT